MVNLKELIAPSFYEVHKDLRDNLHTHYWLKGGRGSTKSSFISIEIAMGMLRDPLANAIVFRKFATSLERSVYNQLKWALNKLEISHLWKITKSPLRMEYLPTGQEILFIGLDDTQKLKSLKPSNGGYFKYSWFEEVNEMDGMAELRNVEQSVMRGGDVFVSFKSFNPPANTADWANLEVTLERADRLVHHSTYLDVPQEWLGKQFFIEAEILKESNFTAYRNEYLGEAVGTGLNIFTNIFAQRITADEIRRFPTIQEGIDWGYSIDPFVFLKCHLDRKHKWLYIFDEIYQVGLSNDDAIEQVRTKHNRSTEIIADSEEPKSVDDFANSGLPIKGARKGNGSVRYGIKKLQGLHRIIIDSERCPNTYREFIQYANEMDKNGNVKAQFPDKDNHTIDAARYALEDEFDY